MDEGSGEGRESSVEMDWLLYQLDRGERLDLADRRTLADKIRRDRKAATPKLTQARLAELSGVALRAIKHMEAAGGTPQTSTLLALTRGIRKHHEEHARMAPEEGQPDPVQMFADVVIPMYRALTPRRRAEALRKVIMPLLTEQLSEENE
ncbi:helix-turn-helix domain-containing protein [Nocardia sp. NPDC051570]|uniref:helix-turn-helix domain-containing protein n=1 Tax=Nocardia sp. NPDC051570 TaxID=3364324 RepID=UPI00379721DB